MGSGKGGLFPHRPPLVCFFNYTIAIFSGILGGNGGHWGGESLATVLVGCNIDAIISGRADVWLILGKCKMPIACQQYWTTPKEGAVVTD